MDNLNDKYSIKNLLFSKAIPNYVIPVPVNGHKIYSCIDCGDRFMFESSYEYHINRKSLEITYMCRHCNQVKVFHNRCNLLSHIRSHAFKTATINVTDLKIEPLPLNYLKVTLPNTSKNIISVQAVQKYSTENTQQPVNKYCESQIRQTTNKSVCFECLVDIGSIGIIYKDRAKHFMQYTNEVFSCPVCLFTLPTMCGLKAHLRLHLKYPPHFCPECGIHLSNKSINYPYYHDCEGFKMMRATTRCKCPITQCPIFHPTKFKEHMRSKHFKQVYKCPSCVVACFSEATIGKHLKTHNDNTKYVLYYQCELCPGRLVAQSQLGNHLRSHNSQYVYPCWTCGSIFMDVSSLIKHHTTNHDTSIDINSINVSETNEIGKLKYKVVKQCDKCRRSFTYRCKYNEISNLPSECPFKCTSDSNSQSTSKDSEDVENQIKCHICKHKISKERKNIREHYTKFHKAFGYLDAKIELTKIDINKYLNKHKKNKMSNIVKKKNFKRNRMREQRNKTILNDIKNVTSTCIIKDNNFTCKKCGYVCEQKEIFENHIVNHRDSRMAYQCMECGECFAVKPSFTTHLFIMHSISDVDDYINKKQCYNEEALLKYKPNNNVLNEPLKENQCNICRELFNNANDLEKHFRVHGMAFLIKNTIKSTNSP